MASAAGSRLVAEDSKSQLLMPPDWAMGNIPTRVHPAESPAQPKSAPPGAVTANSLLPENARQPNSKHAVAIGPAIHAEDISPFGGFKPGMTKGASGNFHAFGISEPGLIETVSGSSELPENMAVGNGHTPITVGSMSTPLSGALNSDSLTRSLSKENSSAARPTKITYAKSVEELLLPDSLSDSLVTNQAAMETTNVATEPTIINQSILATESRPRLIFQPAVPTRDSRGQAILRPTVQLADSPNAEILPVENGILSSSIPSIVDAGDGRLPQMQTRQTETRTPWVPSQIRRAFQERRRRPLVNLYSGVVATMRSQAGRDYGVGMERLPYALFQIDTAKPLNNFQIRFETASDLEFADRVEYFWGRINGKGPQIDALDGGFEPSVDYQDIRLSFEVGGERLSATTEIPLRFIDPTVVANTGGMGDMVLTTKAVMIDGDSFRLTQVLRNQLPTGSVKRGLGNGHASMEPSFVASYPWNEQTLIHNVLGLWFPLGGEPGFSGPILRYGFGVANVLYDSDSFALIPTFEMIGWSILSGQKTVDLLTLPNPLSIDGENIINLFPGLRIVRDTDGALGLWEIGLSSGFTVTERHWYSSILRLDLRFNF